VIVVAGHVRVAAADRVAFLARSRTVVGLARSAPGNLDFVIAADPLDPTRVHVYERWCDRDSLIAFRGDGPDDGLQAMILGADVGEFDVLPARRA
jgi:quinol monooxygenase YgiN